MPYPYSAYGGWGRWGGGDGYASNQLTQLAGVSPYLGYNASPQVGLFGFGTSSLVPGYGPEGESSETSPDPADGALGGVFGAAPADPSAGFSVSPGMAAGAASSLAGALGAGIAAPGLGALAGLAAGMDPAAAAGRGIAGMAGLAALGPIGGVLGALLGQQIGSMFSGPAPVDSPAFANDPAAMAALAEAMNDPAAIAAMNMTDEASMGLSDQGPESGPDPADGAIGGSFGSDSGPGSDAGGGGGEGGGSSCAGGGFVSGKNLTGPVPRGPDDGWQTLQIGEYVVNAKAVKRLGKDMLEQINAGKIPRNALLKAMERKSGNRLQRNAKA